MSLNIELLETSFQAVSPRADDLMDIFYDKLFAQHPQVKSLFETVDMAKQKKQLFASLALVVRNLRKPEVLTDAVGKLGIRHVGYGVRAEHYPLVGQALLEALAEVAGGAWNEELEQAWADAYEALTGIIHNAVRDAQRAA